MAAARRCLADRFRPSQVRAKGRMSRVYMNGQNWFQAVIQSSARLTAVSGPVISTPALPLKGDKLSSAPTSTRMAVGLAGT